MPEDGAKQLAASPSGLQRRLWRTLSAPGTVLALALFGTYAYFPPTAGWNENSRLDLTRALVEHRAVNIDPYHLNTGDKSICGEHYCSDKAPAASWLAMLPYGLYRAYIGLSGAPSPRARIRFADRDRVATGRIDPRDRIEVNISFLVALFLASLAASAGPGVLAALLLARICRGHGASERMALGIAACYGLCTIAFPYSTSLYGHQLAGASLLAAFFAAEQAWSKAASRHDASRWTALAGFCAALAVTAEYPLGVPFCALALYLAVSPIGRRVWWFALGAAPPGALLALYQWRAFGNPLATGYRTLALAAFAQGQGQGFYGLTRPRLSAVVGTLFGRFRGLLYLCPLLALAPVGWVRLWRCHALPRRQLIFAAGIVLFFLLLNASYYMWWGGAAAGPRHVVPMLPFFCLPLWGVFEARSRWPLAAWPLALLSALNMLAVTAAGLKAPEHGDILLDYAWPALLGLGEQAPQQTLGSLAGLSPVPAAWLILVFWAASALLLGRLTNANRLGT